MVEIVKIGQIVKGYPWVQGGYLWVREDYLLVLDYLLVGKSGG